MDRMGWLLGLVALAAVLAACSKPTTAGKAAAPEPAAKSRSAEPEDKSERAEELRFLVEQLPEEVAARVATTPWKGQGPIGAGWSGPAAAGVTMVEWGRKVSRSHGEDMSLSRWGWYAPVERRDKSWRVGVERFALCEPEPNELSAYNQGIWRVAEAHAPFVVSGEGAMAGLDDVAGYRQATLAELDAAAPALGPLGRNMKSFARNFFVDATLEHRSQHWWEATHSLWRDVDASGAATKHSGLLVIPGKRSETSKVEWEVRLEGRVPCRAEGEHDVPADCVLLVGRASTNRPLGLDVGDDTIRELSMLRLVVEPDTLRPHELVETVVQDSVIMHVHLLRVIQLDYGAARESFDACGS